MDPRSRPLSLALAGLSTLAAGLAVGACVFGFRGELAFANRGELDGVETVQLHLPPTQLTVLGDGARTDIDWSGVWSTLGGSSSDALRNVDQASMVWETWEDIGRLRANLPTEVRDLTALDTLEIETASYLAHEIRGAGDVVVTGVDAHLDIELDGGSVEVLGGLEQIRVDTVRGNIQVETRAAVDLHTGSGSVYVASEAPRDLLIETAGSVTLELREAIDIDIDIAEAGAIRVDLDGAAHLGGGHYERVLGSGARQIHVRAGGGAVILRMLPEPEDTDTGTDGTTDTGETSTEDSTETGETDDTGTDGDTDTDTDTGP